MLEIPIKAKTFWDEGAQMFIDREACVIKLEHSLVSISDWEAKYKRAFLGKRGPKTVEEIQDYFYMMTINKDEVDPIVYKTLSMDQQQKIVDYINDPMSCTHMREVNPGKEQRGSSDVQTSEYIYYLMTENGIPFEPCNRWHLNRLLTLIKVCTVKNNQGGMSKKDIARSNALLNASRNAGRKR
jgi:hypothetical protein